MHLSFCFLFKLQYLHIFNFQVSQDSLLVLRVSTSTHFEIWLYWNSNLKQESIFSVKFQRVYIIYQFLSQLMPIKYQISYNNRPRVCVHKHNTYSVHARFMESRFQALKVNFPHIVFQLVN